MALTQSSSAELVILDHLDMLVTGDPTAELDAALVTAATQLQRARVRGDPRAARTLLRWIDHRLDQRNGFIAG